MRGPAGPAAGAVAPGGKSESAAQLGPALGPPGRPSLVPAAPPRRAAPRPAGRPRSPESQLRSAGADSFHSSPAVRSATQVLLWVFSSPPLTRPARICWTPASSGHRRRVPAGGGRGGPASPRVGLGRAPLPREAVPPHGPLTRSPPWRGRRTPPTPVPPPPLQETGKAGCLEEGVMMNDQRKRKYRGRTIPSRLS